MKLFSKIALSLLIMTSVMACIRSKQTQQEHLTRIKGNEQYYKGKDLSELLKQVPDMRSVSIFKDFPQKGITSLRIAFLKDKDFNQEVNLNKSPSHIVVYTEQNPNKPVAISDDKGSEDLNMKEAASKYGNLKITAVHTVTP
ncbi:TPA: hypothetical protein ACG0AB_001398 [Elizabethkingia anophelis]|nr:hypothetical protein [Elizabethkingia anophelis]MCT3962588.1 hypothetical protein [Elizabethkingia anophelis]MCT4212036.1 hypothetical protein [Elizabethkingia anophelis]